MFIGLLSSLTTIVSGLLITSYISEYKRNKLLKLLILITKIRDFKYLDFSNTENENIFKCGKIRIN